MTYDNFFYSIKLEYDGVKNLTLKMNFFIQNNRERYNFTIFQIKMKLIRIFTDNKSIKNKI